MSAALDTLLAPISAETPAGLNLSDSVEGSRALMELETRAQPKSSGQSYAADGSPAGAADEPDWAEIAADAARILGESKDLRVAQILTVAWLKTSGLTGFADGLALIAGLLDGFWGGLYPVLDAEDDDDPTERINVVNNLAAPLGTFGDPWQVVMGIRRSVLFSAPKIGPLHVGSLLAGKGLATALPGLPVLEAGVVEGLLRELPEAQRTALSETVSRASGSLKAIETAFREKTKSHQTPSIAPLQKELTMLTQLLGRPAGDKPADASAMGAAAGAVAAMPGAGAAAPLPTGEIRTREQVVEMLDRICRYYEREEPASPLPLLLRRARRLVGRNFLEVMSDLAPDALSRIRDVTGAEEPEKNNS